MLPYINLIRKIAWSFHRTSGIEWDELFAEASLAFCYAVNTYDPNKGEMGPWVSGFLNKHLMSFLEKERRNSFVDIEEEWIVQPAISPKAFFELFDSLSNDSKEIARIVLDDPHTFLSMSSKKARGRIVHKLREEHGWTWPRIWEGLRTIKKELIETR